MPRSKKGGRPKPRSFPRNKSPNKARSYGSSKRSPTRSKRPISKKRFRGDKGDKVSRELARISTSYLAKPDGHLGTVSSDARTRAKRKQPEPVHDKLKDLENDKNLRDELGSMIDSLLAGTDSAQDARSPYPPPPLESVELRETNAFESISHDGTDEKNAIDQMNDAEAARYLEELFE